MGLTLGISGNGAAYNYLADAANVALYNAITKGSVSVVFAGHSVVEGDAAQMEGYNIWTEEFVRQLEAKFPSVTFTDINYGLPSRNISMMDDDDFKGVGSPDPGDGTGFYKATGTYNWQNASVIGKSWIDHIKDESPDLVVLEFGLNSGLSTANFKTAYESIVDKMQAWSKVPSIAIMTEMLPTMDSDPHLDKNGTIKLYNDAIRDVCADKGCTAIDVGRQWQLVRDGQDPLVFQDVRYSLDTFVKLSGNDADTLTYNSIGEATNNHNYERDVLDSYNVNVTGSIVLNASGSIGNFGFRYSDTTWSSGIAVQIKETQVKIWENGVNVQNDTHADITVGVASTFEVDLDGEDLTVKIDGTTYSTYTTTKLDYGQVSIGGQDYDITNCVYNAVLAYPVVQTAKYTSNEMVGNKTATDWNNGDRADGGNSLNHPSRTGLAEGFYPAIREFVNKLYK